MYTFMVEYTENNGATIGKMLVNAEDLTKAYLQAVSKLPITAIITECFKV